MMYLVGFGIGIVFTLGVLVPSVNEHLEVSFSQWKKTYSNLFNIISNKNK
jgi:hypothetical protein